MASGLGRNGEVQAERLVVHGTLPASGIDSKFVRVERNQKVFCADVPPLLRNRDAPDWNNARYLKQTFTTPPTGRQRKRQESPLAFPYCLLTFGPTASSLRERLIVVILL